MAGQKKSWKTPSKI
jgi:hypothetical protein